MTGGIVRGDAAVGALLRGYVAAVLVYVACHVALWDVMYTHPRPRGWREVAGLGILALMCITFVAVAGRLALLPNRSSVVTAALVSSAALFTSGLARTYMAARGMWQFFQWDHDHVVRGAVTGDAWFALSCFPLALVVAAASRLIFRRTVRKAGDELLPQS
ncbi:MAG TPA: hypothetical protein VFT45_07840 [Longimicrobium sp.]|nr:hypothetical protein [Longimicrobium sp.]